MACSDTGIGDFGQEGIDKYLKDHICGLVCKGLGLDKKVLRLDDEGGDSSDEDNEDELDSGGSEAQGAE